MLSKFLFVIISLFLLANCASAPKKVEQEPEVIEPVVEQPEEVVEEAVIEPVETPEDFNRAFYEEALIALKAGKIELAIEILKPVSQDAPKLESVFTNLGLAHYQLKNFEPAKKAFEKAVIANENDAVAYNHLGIIHRQEGDFQKALEIYKLAIEADDDYAPAYLNIGILYDIYLQDLPNALVNYNQYQSLTNNEDKSVSTWIVDIERRIKSGQG